MEIIYILIMVGAVWLYFVKTINLIFAVYNLYLKKLNFSEIVITTSQNNF